MSEAEELALLRDQIDQIDYQIHDLINERAKLALKVCAVKVKHNGPNANFFRPEREKAILDQIHAHNQGPLDENAICRVFEGIIKECLELQINTTKHNDA